MNMMPVVGAVYAKTKLFLFECAGENDTAFYTEAH